MSVQVLQQAPATPVGYSPMAVVLHWLVAALLVGQVLFGWYLEEVPRGTPARTIYVNLHKSTGLVLGLLILWRLYWRLRHPAPDLPSTFPSWQRVAARVSHIALYACMIVMPLSGYLASNFSKYGVKLFNAILLPPWGMEDRSVYAFFNTTHVVTSYVFVTLIGLHVAAALQHAWRRDGIFSRMLLRRD
jgi:cytochrome b561